MGRCASWPDSFPAVVKDFAGSALTVPVPVVLGISADIPPARGVSRHCLTGSAHRPPDLIAWAGLLSHLASTVFRRSVTGRTYDWCASPCLVFLRCGSALSRLCPAKPVRSNPWANVGLVSCDWLRPVTRGRGVWLLQSASWHTPL